MSKMTAPTNGRLTMESKCCGVTAIGRSKQIRVPPPPQSACEAPQSPFPCILNWLLIN